MKHTHVQLTHYRRFRGYDYSRGVTLFVTLTTAPRRQVFGRVVDAVMLHSPLGKLVIEALQFAFARRPQFKLIEFVVMPDHLHFLFHLCAGLEQRAAIKEINTLIGRFKSYTAYLWHQVSGESGSLWQQGFHDWICLSREMIDAVIRYIRYNPLKWELRNYRHLVQLHEPLKSPRLGLKEYWRGLGAIEILNEERAMVSLRVSRQCNQQEVADVVARVSAKAGEFSVISGFISGGERAVLDALLANPTAKIIKIMPYALAHDYSPPVTLMPAISEGRLAIIARGNSPAEISRNACLDYNARIIDIADKAAYALPGGVKWLK